MARRKSKKKKSKSKKNATPKKGKPVTIHINLNKDGKLDTIRIYHRKHQKGNVYVANVKFGTTEMKRKKKRK